VSAGELAWQGRSVFVTGAAGFVGSWLCDALAKRGARVTGLVRPDDQGGPWRPFLEASGVSIAPAFVEDPPAIERIVRDCGAEAVFHLAAVNINVGTSVSPLVVFETNVRGTWSVLEACRVAGTVRRAVVASSREAEQPRKVHPYPASKISAELIARAYADTYELPVAISRSDNVYGGRDFNWNRLIPGTLRLLLNGEAPRLRSDGTLLRDYVYVDDMVDAYLRLAARAGDAGVRGEMFHFATGVGTSAQSVVAELCELAGTPQLRPVVLNETSGERVDPPRSTERERAVLGWTSAVSLHDGLRRTFDWYRAHLS
jgi:CDP-glucose 4,6-dehydratase